jgi:transcriptional regulator with XRE-family HTH domain
MAWTSMARSMAVSVGHEVLLARANLGLSRRQAARLARVSPQTQRRVEDGDPSVAIDTACRVASALGLKLWAKAFPITTPSLRDSGQLRIAQHLRQLANASYSLSFEVALANGRAADMVLYSPDEILHVEIERRLADWQAQYRAAVAKRDEIAAQHQRPVRLVIVVEDTERNRRAIRAHPGLIASTLPAGSREVMRAIQAGQPLRRDGILWFRPRDHR